MRQARTPTLLSLLLLTGLAACASAGPNVQEARFDPFIIRFDELHAAPYGSAYEAVEKLRPRWVRSRSQRLVARPSEIAVYVDRVHFGTLQSLQSIPTEGIEAIEWMDAETATQRWGKDHASPAIAVRSRR